MRPIVAALLKAIDRGTCSDGKQVIGSVESVLDVVPEHQAEKIAVLAEIRTLLDDDAMDALDESERNELAELKPPVGISPITRRGPAGVASRSS